MASLNHANSQVLLDKNDIKEKAKLSLDLILEEEKPELIDESGDSTGKVSIQDMKNGIFKNGLNDKITLQKLANLIIRGGWPSNIKTPEDRIGIIPRSYIDTILDKHIKDDKKRDKNKMAMLLKSLARNESTDLHTG